MIDFDTKYASAHERIFEDKEFMRCATYFAQRMGLRSRGRGVSYHDLQHVGATHLGIDLLDSHVRASFGEIVAKMRLLYELSDGSVDLSSVYFRLTPYLGIISENVAYDTSFFKDSASLHEIDFSLLTTAFQKESLADLTRTTFTSKKGNKTRFPIIDLDHVDVRSEYASDFEKWSKYYERGCSWFNFDTSVLAAELVSQTSP